MSACHSWILSRPKSSQDPLHGSLLKHHARRLHVPFQSSDCEVHIGDPINLAHPKLVRLLVSEHWVLPFLSLAIAPQLVSLDRPYHLRLHGLEPSA